VLSQPEGTVVERFDRRDKVSLKSQVTVFAGGAIV